MNYQKIYNRLMFNARSRDVLEGYTEQHHVIPRSLGGSDSDDNIVVLTAREHFVAHLLLAKVYGGKMWHAIHMMSNMRRYNSRMYDFVRIGHAKQASITHSGKVVPAETRKKISENKERAANISSSLRGKQKTAEHVDAWYSSRASGGGWVCPDAKKESQSVKMVGSGNPMWGKTHSDEAKRKIKEANAKKVTCPHCGKIGGIAIMKRWHFSNCKVLTNK